MVPVHTGAQRPSRRAWWSSERMRTSPMIRHIAVFTFADEATDKDIDAMEARLAGLPDVIEVIRSYTFGRDLRLSGEGHDYAVVGDFDSPEDYHTYATHPAHLHVVDTYVKPIIDGVVRVQIDVDQV
jgi:hypothetical protein